MTKRVVPSVVLLLLSLFLFDRAFAQTQACPDTCPTGCQGPGGIDHDGDCCCDQADNCPRVYNPSQADTFGDPHRGDACEGDRVIYVAQPGTFPSPCQHDYGTIQEAVDSALPLADVIYKISICTGLAPYQESVTLDASSTGKIFRFIANPALGPVTIDGGAGPAFDVQVGNDRRAHAIHGFRLEGQQGVHASADTKIEECSFTNIADTAIALDAGDHRLTSVTMDATVNNGITVAGPANVSLDFGSMVGLTGLPIAVDGTATLDGSLIAGAGATGIRLGTATSSLDVRYSTIADSAGAGIDDSAGGIVTVENSIVYGNAGGDLVGVACVGTSWSDIGSPNCAGVNNSVSANPGFSGPGDYHLVTASPLLDYGPSPATYDGAPCEDLDGGLRLLDYDGDGIAIGDPGPYEKANRDPDGPGQTQNELFLDKVTFAWDAVAGATEYHDYRGDLATLSYADFGSCVDDLDPVRTDTQFADATLPALGAGFFYLVTAEDATGEGTLGFNACAERSNFSPCP